MPVSKLLENLNTAQREAVCAPKHQHCLVLSGAGSGKTRVLTYRMAWLLKNEAVTPSELLAMTFTNKAAAEMRKRVEELVGVDTQHIWVGTFHSIGHRLLRMHHGAANLPDTFQILDTDDQLRLIKRIMKEQNINEKQLAPKQAQHFINTEKDAGRRPYVLQEKNQRWLDKTLHHLYQTYEIICQRTGLVDFAELLLRGYELFKKNPELKTHYHHRFGYILVDEFQDTNTIQYALLKQLAGPKTGLFVVGDDDQSIYGWRGARIENIQQFGSDFENTQLFRLEQNYRSTSTILSAANAVIGNNEKRIGKTLWTQGEAGNPIVLYAAFNEIDEARFLVDRIQELLQQGYHLGNIAILYRSNAQSRVLEEAFLNARVPYKIYGGLRFLDRLEVKDALAYLRLVANRNDDSAFERALCTPPRGIGEKTLEIIRGKARASGTSLWQAAIQLLLEELLTTRAQQVVQNFLSFIDQLENDLKELPLPVQVESIIARSGLSEIYLKMPGEKGQFRAENLEELVNVSKRFQAEEKNIPGQTPLIAFLSRIVLENEEDETPAEDSVHLMTLHAAKGLEFSVVMLCGLEEGLFPHHTAAGVATILEEERRLCYVGMTRAKQLLWITYAQKRHVQGQEKNRSPSRFIQEIPTELLRTIPLRTVVSRAIPSYAMTISYTTKPKPAQRLSVAHESGFKLGERVKHVTFGEGMIMSFEGTGKQTRVQVKFNKAGPKWLVLSYAKLERAHD